MPFLKKKKKKKPFLERVHFGTSSFQTLPLKSYFKEKFDFGRSRTQGPDIIVRTRHQSYTDLPRACADSVSKIILL